MTLLRPELKSVIDNDLCIACGVCIPACPLENLEPAFNEYRGSNEVKFTSGADCTNCSAPCIDVCPSIKIDFSAISDSDRQLPERDGWIENIYLGYSPLYRDDGKSSSGGVLRALAQYALKENIPVLTLTKSEETEIEYLPSVLREERELSRMPGSIYHSSSFVGAIEYLQELTEPCVIIAIPCQLAGILNYIAHVEPKLREKIRFTYGIVCGWMYSYHAHEAFKTYKNIRSPLTDIKYRGGDKVGLLKLKTQDDNYKFNRRVFAKFSEKIDYRSAYSTDLNKLRCRVCQDHTNLLADIVAGDAWLERKQSEKLSIIGTRTLRGENLLTTLVSRGYLVVEKGSFSDVLESQSENLVYGSIARKLARFLTRKGINSPDFYFKFNGEEIQNSISDRFFFQLEFFRRDLVRKRYYRFFWWVYLIKYIYNNFVLMSNRVFKKIKKMLGVK